MTTEKELDMQLKVLKRQIERIYAALGISDKDIEKMRRDDALQHAIETGDHSLIQKHLRETNCKKSSSAA